MPSSFQHQFSQAASKGRQGRVGLSWGEWLGEGGADGAGEGGWWHRYRGEQLGGWARGENL